MAGGGFRRYLATGFRIGRLALTPWAEQPDAGYVAIAAKLIGLGQRPD